MKKIDIVNHILRQASHRHFTNNEGIAWAPSNVALCKYWGKRDPELNLPVTSSLSVSLGNKGAFTKIKHNSNADNFTLNDTLIGPETKFAKRLKYFLDLFRPQGINYSIAIDTNVPLSCGFASSACGFASLVQALNNLYNWELDKKNLSILARLGSGSACRSLFEGFVEWQKGDSFDGIDSYGVKLEYTWPELRIGMLTISTNEKVISSRDAMELTVNTSPLYSSWPEQVTQDITNLKLALAHKDFILFGEIAENNATSMHRIMRASKPPIIYSLPETFTIIDKIREMRLFGTPLFFTQDAGPNLQLLFLDKYKDQVLRVFPELEVVAPFANTTQIILVDDNDVATDISEKLLAHIHGKLHRAFSVVVLRKNGADIEMLLQKRSSTKYHSANLWSNACCGHPKPGEEIVIAAKKRLQEEMGFSVPLKKIGQFHYQAKFSDVNLIENEIDHVIVGFSNVDDFPFNTSEVQDYRWIKISELKQDLQKNPHKYTAWLPQVVAVCRKVLYLG